ncbi:hypothetical protein [Micromonospora deserti]|uniref:hypothetical protein n=1 Tax=Micromonospora deserti TaxID=2070366 RepID=UPI0013143408|nr:hypothetical protein [Micromonospora deserti]
MMSAEATVLAYWEAGEPATGFFDLDDAGAIRTITEFWPEPYDPPAGRGHLVERY